MIQKVLGALLLLCSCLSANNDAWESHMQENSKRIALVTGASSGIGKALVIELLSQGYEVIGVSSSQDKLTKLHRDLNNAHLSIFACDVSKIEEVEGQFLALQKNQTVPKLFFLNAGIAGQSAMEALDSLDLEAHQKIFSVNYYGVLNFVKAWLEPCKKQGGATFIVSSSINAIFAPPGGSAYSASKAAIAKAFDGLRLAHRSSNLYFLNVFCGPVDTPGLSGKLPFTWSAEKMAKYMIKKAKQGSNQSHPSWFYSSLAGLLNKLPTDWTLKVLGWLGSQKETER